MSLLTDNIKYACLRIARMEEVKKVNKKKMEKTYLVDAYWKKKNNKYELTEEQLQEVNQFWKKYKFAYENDPSVQAYYTYVSGRFDPKYFAEGLNAYYMYRFYDSPVYHSAFHDKNYRELLFGEENCSEAFVRRINKKFFDSSRKILSFDEAINKLYDYVQIEEKLIVKPTPGGGGGGIKFIKKGDSKDKIASIVQGFTKDDLIIEKIFHAHEKYAAANATSLNSLRIITLLYNNQINVLAILFRMGADGKEVDNFTQGGIACGVNLNGICMDYGFDHFGNRYEKHPNGFDFKGYYLPSVDKAIEFATKLHWKIPQFKQMSWDIVIDQNGEPKLIEMNPRGESKLYQSIGVLPYGEYTEQILDEYLLLYYYKWGGIGTGITKSIMIILF